MTLPSLVPSAVGKATYYHATCPSVDDVRFHAERFDKMLRQLNAAVLAGDNHRSKKLTELILKSDSAKLTCLVLSHKGKLSKGMTLEQLAQKLNMYRSLKEPVEVKLEAKSNGDFRPIVIPGVLRLAAQTMCALIMLKHGMRWDFDYLAPKRGTVCAVEQLVKILKEGNHDYVVTADVKDCFPSLKLQKVKDHLPLPEDVTRNAIYLSDGTPLVFHPSIPTIDQEMLGQVVRKGLPQGSPASGVAASWLVGKLLSAIGASGKCILFGDDMAIAACSEAEAKAIKDALLLAANNHICGPLALKHLSIAHVEKGFEYLKYWLRRWNNTEAPKFSIHPCLSAFENFHKKYAEILAISKENAEEYAEAWKNAFSAWKPTALGEEYFWLNKTIATLGVKKTQTIKQHEHNM